MLVMGIRPIQTDRWPISLASVTQRNDGACSSGKSLFPWQHPRFHRGEGGQSGLILFKNGIEYAKVNKMTSVIQWRRLDTQGSESSKLEGTEDSDCLDLQFYL